VWSGNTVLICLPCREERLYQGVNLWLILGGRGGVCGLVAMFYSISFILFLAYSSGINTINKVIIKNIEDDMISGV